MKIMLRKTLRLLIKIDRFIQIILGGTKKYKPSEIRLSSGDGEILDKLREFDEVCVGRVIKASRQTRLSKAYVSFRQKLFTRTYIMYKRRLKI